MRVHKYLAVHGIASRRKAENLVREGRVQINGKVAQVGDLVDLAKDRVKVDGKLVQSLTDFVYLILHKPPQVVSTTSDPENRKTVLDLLPKKYRNLRLYPVGRLDYESEGLILMTNDGDYAYRITHPKFMVPKSYRVKFAGKLSVRAIQQLTRGVKLVDGITAPAEVYDVELGNRFSWCTLVIKEGRNRQIRRMGEAIGHTVIRLIRTKLGPYELAELNSGECKLVAKLPL